MAIKRARHVIPPDLVEQLGLAASQPNDADPNSLPDEQDPARQPMPSPVDPNAPIPGEVEPPAPDPEPGPHEDGEDEPPPDDDGEDAPQEDDEDDEVFVPPPDAPQPDPIQAKDPTHYESRIQILDAFQYPGGLAKAPEWVDRNWTAYADLDQLRDIPAGPALRVPLPSGDVICRIGDYVCRQSVTLAPGLEPDIRLEVWSREQFEKLFVPREQKPFRPFNPAANATIEGTIIDIGTDEIRSIQPR